MYGSDTLSAKATPLATVPRPVNGPAPRPGAGQVSVRIAYGGICGSDLHIYRGKIPGMKSGDILGHEFMGIVEDVGPGVSSLRPGDRVVVPFTISCGACRMCAWGNYSCCERTNPDGAKLAKLIGYSTAGIFGYSHLFGGYAGGQAEYVRVPFADVGPFPVPRELPDEKVLFMTDILATAFSVEEFLDQLEAEHRIKPEVREARSMGFVQ